MREKNRLSVFHKTSSFRPGGSKMSSSCQNSVHNSTLCVFDTLGDWFRGSRVAHFSSNLDTVSSYSKAVFSVASLWNVVYIVKYSIYSGGSKISIFSVSPQSCSLFSASFHTFCLTARAYLNTQKYGLFCSLLPFNPYVQFSEGLSAKRSEE